MAEVIALDAAQRARFRAQRSHPALGLEALEHMGIDIDQDPRAFAQFLELKNLMQARSSGIPQRRPWSPLNRRR